MKNTKWILYLVVGWIYISGCQLVRGQMMFDACVRPRGEYRNAYKKWMSNDQQAIFLISQRTRLRMDWKKSALQVVVGIQDVRIWGDDTQVSATGVFGDQASIDLAEAFISFDFTHQLAIKVGRQFLSFDDGRLLAKRNWNQNGLFYDAAVVSYNKEDWKLKTGFTYNNTDNALFLSGYDPRKMKMLSFLHVENKVNTAMKLSAIEILSGYNRSDSSSPLYVKSSTGINVIYSANQWSCIGGFYYQYGKEVYQGQVQTVSAYNLNALLRYQTDNMMLEIGFSLLSGDRGSDSLGGETHLFDLLYGSRHKYYGYLDYFSNLRVSTQNSGLNDCFFTAGVSIAEDWKVNGTGHLFCLNQLPLEQRLSDQVISNSYLGTEFDLALEADIYPGVNIQTGYSFMLYGETLKKLQYINGGVPFAQWAWLMVTVSLKSKLF